MSDHAHNDNEVLFFEITAALDELSDADVAWLLATYIGQRSTRSSQFSPFHLLGEITAKMGAVVAQRVRHTHWIGSH